MYKKIILTMAAASLIGSNYAHAATRQQTEVVYKEEIAEPKRFYFSFGIGATKPWNTSVDFSRLPSDLETTRKNVNETIERLNIPVDKFNLDNLNLAPKFGLGANSSVSFGYVTDNFGRFEVEGFSTLQPVEGAALLLNNISLNLMSNWYVDLINMPSLDVFAGVGAGYSWNHLRFGGIKLDNVQHWAAQAKTGVSFHLNDNVDIVASYSLFSSLDRNSFNFENSVLKGAVETIENWGKRATQTGSENTPQTKVTPLTTKSSYYRVHGPKLEIRIKL